MSSVHNINVALQSIVIQIELAASSASKDQHKFPSAQDNCPPILFKATDCPVYFSLWMHFLCMLSAKPIFAHSLMQRM